MADERLGRDWQGLAEEVWSGMAEWRVQHPRATLLAIEQEVDVRLAGLRARLVQDLALRSRQTDVRALAAGERPRCPDCGEPLEARGTKVRRLTTTHHREVALERSYAVCPRCGRGLFPPG